MIYRSGLAFGEVYVTFLGSRWTLLDDLGRSETGVGQELEGLDWIGRAGKALGVERGNEEAWGGCGIL